MEEEGEGESTDFAGKWETSERVKNEREEYREKEKKTFRR